MIKIKVVVILMVAVMGITAVPIQASEKQGDSKKQENKATQVISDEEQELLKKEDIQVVSDENGNIKLKNTSQNTINEANHFAEIKEISNGMVSFKKLFCIF